MFGCVGEGGGEDRHTPLAVIRPASDEDIADTRCDLLSEDHEHKTPAAVRAAVTAGVVRLRSRGGVFHVSDINAKLGAARLRSSVACDFRLVTFGADAEVIQPNVRDIGWMSLHGLMAQTQWPPIYFDILDGSRAGIIWGGLASRNRDL